MNLIGEEGKPRRKAELTTMKNLLKKLVEQLYKLDGESCEEFESLGPARVQSPH